ncbi:hypothetical protein AbraIFM66951_008171 [Aspergillus brasiliensis]|uniref:Alpha/beta hydrolase fold-3 domain-containing protein n=1 Tax=Aspergillus brasiliensis TaxID=319629 RepID=A0A9W5YNX4_9EURO|nr:hypothetical protein AbraCBS73388_005286 [Aspergillus brasiliensis]GKZ45518.1 hypothetical protein AbraIFM66951_008171 [Aspergillus brasiliensis]
MAFQSHSKFDGFDLIQATYKKIGDHAIETSVLVPHTPCTGKRPTIIRFHGGGLICGDSLEPQYWPQWLSDLALLHGAVIVCPNYRLMPEANGLDIYDDVEDFWTWLHTPVIHEILAAHQTPTDLDLTRIILAGDSAGGLLSINLALSHGDSIRAAIATYPPVALNAPEFTETRTILPVGVDTPKSSITEYLTSHPLPHRQVSSGATPTRWSLMLAATQHGVIGKWYAQGSEESPRRELIYPMERLGNPGVQIPRGGIILLHGRQDSVVPVQQSERFVARAREVTQGQLVGDMVVLVSRDGEHEFDAELRYDEPWLKDALKKVVETWLELSV